MVEENYFRTGNEEVMLELQTIIQKAIFQYNLAVGNVRYALSRKEYYHGRMDQVLEINNYYKELYDNAVAKTMIRGFDNDRI